MEKFTVARFVRMIKKLFYVATYFFAKHHGAVRKLSSYGFSEIRPYHIRRWFRVINGKTLMRNYYKAIYCNKPCFIKVTTTDETIKNEIYINKYLASCGASFAPALLVFDELYGPETTMIAIEHLPDVCEFTIPDDADVFEAICCEFEQILCFFSEHAIFHGDITAPNILLTRQNHIFLIDFGLGKAPGSEVFNMFTSFPRGIYHRLENDTCIYDDAYSFIKMLEDCGIPEKYKQMNGYRKIQQLIGVHTHSEKIASGRC